MPGKHKDVRDVARYKNVFERTSLMQQDDGSANKQRVCMHAPVSCTHRERVHMCPRAKGVYACTGIPYTHTKGAHVSTSKGCVCVHRYPIHTGKGCACVKKQRVRMHAPVSLTHRQRVRMCLTAKGTHACTGVPYTQAKGAHVLKKAKGTHACTGVPHT
eukprot:scaffold13537_cov22-Tisochrysis_lutea.AAC.1